MKVSYYELLGMIKDGKQPKQVKLNDDIYIWGLSSYCNDNNETYLNDYIEEIQMFNKDIEIIEELKQIEKLDIYGNVKKKIYLMSKDNIKYSSRVIDKIIIDKINELVEAVNELKAKE